MTTHLHSGNRRRLAAGAIGCFLLVVAALTTVRAVGGMGLAAVPVSAPAAAISTAEGLLSTELSPAEPLSPPPPTVDQVRFVLFETNCGYGSAATFNISGTPVGTLNYGYDCTCNPGEKVFVLDATNDPDGSLRALASSPQCTTFGVTFGGGYGVSYLLGYVRAEVTIGGVTQNVCISDASGNDCAGYSDVCSAYTYWSPGVASVLKDTNGNGVPDCTDPDIDGDGVPNAQDNCPYVVNPNQADSDGNGVGDACQPTVVAVPWAGNRSKPHVVYSGGSIVLQASASPGGYGAKIGLASGTWDPGDGSGPQAINVSNSRSLELVHTYVGDDYTPFTATVTVVDASGHSYSDTFKVQIVPKSLDVEANMAIDRALWYEHKAMTLPAPSSPTVGNWTSDNANASTASTVQAMEVNGHRETGDPMKDPYVDDVARGLRFLQQHVRRLTISSQPAGDPDTNGNGYGLETDGDHVVYVGGQIIDAFVASGTPGALATTGSETGRTYKDIVQDMLDAYSFGQNEYNQGGWIYNWNDEGGIDSSSSGWWGVGAHAGNVWGLTVPSWVTNENLTYGIPNLQNFDGSGQGYDGSCGYRGPNGNVAETGACLIMMSADGVARTAPRFQASEQWIARQWGGDPHGSMYGMYNLTKAMRLATGGPITLLGGTIDWYGADPNPGNPTDGQNGLARYLVGTQGGDGSWGGDWVSGSTSTAWGVLILAPALFELGPTAACSVDASSVCQAGAAGGCNTTGTDPWATVHFDGSQSTVGDNAIASYSWNFDDGGSTSDASTVTASTSYSTTGVKNATLKVTDIKGNSSTVTCPVLVTSSALDPIASAGGPYTMCIGDSSLVLDASGSTGRGSNINTYEWDFKGAINFAAIDATGVTTNQAAYFNSLGAGTYDVGVRVTDDLAHPSVVKAYSTVTVRDCAPPVITVPANISAVTPNPSVVVTYAAPSATDNVDGTDPVTCVSSPTAGLSSGSSFPVGTTTITCDASDHAGNHAATKSFTVTVSNNRPPEPVNDQGATYSGTPVTVNVLANDGDPDFDLLSITAVTQGANGSVADNGNGTVTYTPVTGFAGTDTFSYTVSDGKGGTATAMVTITVTKHSVTATAGGGGNVYDGATHVPSACVVTGAYIGDLTCTNTPAIAGPNVGTTVTAPVVTGTGMSNFTITSVNGAYAITAAALTVKAADVTAPHGVAFPAFTVSYAGFAAGDTPASLGGALSITTTATLASGVGTYPITPSGLTSGNYTIAFVNGTLTLTNQAPVAVNDAYSGQWNTAVVIPASGVLSNDSDPNNDSITAIKVTNPAHGTVILNANGSFSYMPSANYSGVDSFTYKANDGALDSNPATVTITIVSPCRTDDDDRDGKSNGHRIGDGDDHDRGIKGHHDGDGCEHDRAVHRHDRDDRGQMDWDSCKPGTPSSKHDEYDTRKNTALTVAPKGVLKNDGPFAATAELFTAPSHGTVTLGSNGGFVYTPTANFVGTDRFYYVPRSAAGVAGAVTSATIEVKGGDDKGKDSDKDKDKDKDKR